MIEGKRICVTGGGGSIGSELVRQLSVKNNVYILDNNETAFFDLVEELQHEGRDVDGRLCDIRDRELVQRLINDYSPEIIFHAAALKHVTPSMQTPREYVNTNLIGTLNVIEAAIDNHCRFINVSTDKSVNSDNVMGWSKRGTELFTKIAGGISVRFGNVLGSRGSVIPLWQKQINEGKPVTVTDERMTRYMMSVEDAVELVIEAAEKGQPGEIYILDLEKREVNVLELAKEIISKAGSDVPIKIIGARPGESLSEKLYGENESPIKEGRFLVLR